MFLSTYFYNFFRFSNSPTNRDCSIFFPLRSLLYEIISRLFALANDGLIRTSAHQKLACGKKRCFTGSIMTVDFYTLTSFKFGIEGI